MDTSIIEFVNTASENITTGSSTATSDFGYIWFTLLAIIGCAAIIFSCIFLGLRSVSTNKATNVLKAHVNKNELTIIITSIFLVVFVLSAFFFTKVYAFASVENKENFSVTENVRANVGDYDISWENAYLTNNGDYSILVNGITTDLICKEAKNVEFTIKNNSKILYSGTIGQTQTHEAIVVKAHETISIEYSTSADLETARKLTGKQIFSAQFLCDESSLESIFVSKQPTKTVYQQWEIFDPAGMEVMGVLSSGAVLDLTDVTISSQETLVTLGDKEVGIASTYKEITKTTTVVVHVVPKSLIHEGSRYFPVFTEPISGVKWYRDEEPVYVESMFDIAVNGVNGYTIEKRDVRFKAVRTVEESWDAAFGGPDIVPSGQATQYIGTSMHDDDYCETLGFVKTGEEAPTIDGISINYINLIYQLNPSGDFWSCVASNDIYAYDWYCLTHYWWSGYRTTTSNTISIVFSRYFS